MSEEQIRKAATELALRITGKYIVADAHGGPVGAADMFLDFYNRIYKRLAEKTAVRISVESTGPVSDLSKIPPVPWEMMG